MMRHEDLEAENAALRQELGDERGRWQRHDEWMGVVALVLAAVFFAVAFAAAYWGLS